LALAAQAYDEAMDAIRAVTAPSRGRHHHQHLLRAALWIGRALVCARRGRGPSGTLEIETTSLLLRRGWQEFRRSKSVHVHPALQKPRRACRATTDSDRASHLAA
jgi:hypothetical protein